MSCNLPATASDLRVVVSTDRNFRLDLSNQGCYQLMFVQTPNSKSWYLWSSTSLIDKPTHLFPLRLEHLNCFFLWPFDTLLKWALFFAPKWENSNAFILIWWLSGRDTITSYPSYSNPRKKTKLIKSQIPIQVKHHYIRSNLHQTLFYTYLQAHLKNPTYTVTLRWKPP